LRHPQLTGYLGLRKMFFLHALLIFQLCTFAVALPGLPPRSTETPVLFVIPKAAEGRYYRFIDHEAVITQSVRKEYINDVMILGSSRMVELCQLENTPGALTSTKVLRTFGELNRVEGYWIRFPTGRIIKDYSQMVHVEVGSTFKVTPHDIKVDPKEHSIPISKAFGYYYNSKVLMDRLTDNDYPEAVLTDVLQIVSSHQCRLHENTEHGVISVGAWVGMYLLQNHWWIPFPVAVLDVETAQTRNRRFHLTPQGTLIFQSLTVGGVV